MSRGGRRPNAGRPLGSGTGRRPRTYIPRQITAPAAEWDAIRAEAERDGLSVSEWMRRAAQAFIDKGKS